LWTELCRRLASHRGGQARSEAMDLLHQGLSHAIAKGVSDQLHCLFVAREGGYVEGSSPI
jgi:hypothetical protein